MRSNNCLLAKRRLLAALSAPLILILGSAVAQSASPPHKIQRHSTESVLLYLWAAPVDFSEYRGLQLGEEGGETKFDATLIPDDWTQTPECAVSQGPYEAGMMYRYSCAATFPLLSDAVKARDGIVARYVTRLDAFNASQEGSNPFKAIVEDEVREHGLYANAKKNMDCSPQHCLFEHVYATNQVVGKLLQISVDPIFTASPLAAAKAKREGKPLPASGESGEGRLSIIMFSVGPPLKSKGN